MILKTLTSSILSRLALASKLGVTFGGKRDIYSALGYNKTPTIADYWARYCRQDIAKRIVDAFPQATWQQPPRVLETEEDKETKFETEFKSLATRLKLWHYLDRVDKLAGIGQYAALLIGTRDGRGLEQRLGKLESPDDILYLSPFIESNISINKLDSDKTSVRFGQPEEYKLKFTKNLTQETITLQEMNVHHSRVIHIADGMLENDIFGIPRLRNVLNLLDDLQKVVGGSAEMFWNGAFKGFQADIDKDMQLDPNDASDLSDEIDEWTHGIRRWIRTKGVDIKAFEAENVDPRGSFQTIMGLISGTTGIPQRILMGSERGQLASEQDERNWMSRVLERQKNFAEPIVLRPLVDFFINSGALTKPKEYHIDWPDLTALDDSAQSTVAMRVGIAVKAISESGGIIVTSEEFRKGWLKLPAKNTQLNNIPDPSKTVSSPVGDNIEE